PPGPRRRAHRDGVAPRGRSDRALRAPATRSATFSRKEGRYAGTNHATIRSEPSACEYRLVDQQARLRRRIDRADRCDEPQSRGSAARLLRGMPPVILHNPVLAYENGKEFIKGLPPRRGGRAE